MNYLFGFTILSFLGLSLLRASQKKGDACQASLRQIIYYPCEINNTIMNNTPIQKSPLERGAQRVGCVECDWWTPN